MTFAMRSPSLAAAFRLAGALAPCLATPLLTSGCAAPPAESAPAESLPAYSADAMQVFDDGIDPHAVGLELDYGNPRTDPRVRARARASDIILRARVMTVTGSAGQGGRSYQLTLRSLERLGGKHPLGDDLIVVVDKASPSLGIVKAMEGQLVGKVFVTYLKAFGRPDGQRELHFHASADDADVVASVKNAVLLDELR
jgi:hypothetical protein